MISTKKIRLKEAYALYKKERKFERDIKELKENNSGKEWITLIAGFSYVFNMYRNKKQYEKNHSKEMQYAFLQTVIEVGGKYAKFDISADFLQHSLEEKTEDLYITKGKVVDEIKKIINLRRKFFK